MANNAIRRSRLQKKPTKKQVKEAALETSRLSLVAGRAIVGFVHDPTALDRRFSIEILLDGLVVATTHADLFVPELAHRGIGDGRYGFATYLNETLLAAARTLTARVANVHHAVGEPIDLAAPNLESKDLRPRASIRWLGGLRFSGWIDDNTPIELTVIVDEEIVMPVHAGTWTRIDEDWQQQGGRNGHAFDFHLHERFADGSMHTLRLRSDDGVMLPVSCSFTAFPNRLATALESLGNHDMETSRRHFYDRLIPVSVPLHGYAAWRERFPLPTPRPSELQLAIAVIGSEGAEETISTLEAQSHRSWTAGIIEGTALAIDSAAFGEFLADDGASADAIVVTIAGTLFAESALARIAAAFEEHEAASVVYADLEQAAGDGSIWPLALPAFDYERMLEQGYCAHLFALRQQAAIEALGRHPANIYRLFNSVLDAEAASAPVLHLPGAIAVLPRIDFNQASSYLASASEQHLKARGISADINAVRKGSIFPAVRVRRAALPQRTTLIIPTRDKPVALKRCIDSIAPAVGRCKAGILIVDNDSIDPAGLAYLDELKRQGIEVARIEGPLNVPRLCNRAAAGLDADNLVFLNNDIEAVDDDWLEEMLARLSEPDTGAVGALLHFPSGVVNHGGIVLGPDFPRALLNRLADDAGYINSLHVAHEVAAMSAACLLVRRKDFLTVGGMDERLAAALYDVDLCLKLREIGRRIVMTPHARLVSHESVRGDFGTTTDPRLQFECEKSMLRDRWGQFLLEDPTYNPQLALDRLTHAALAWPPRDRRPRFMRRPAAATL